MLARFLRHVLFNLVHLVFTILVAVKSVHRRIVTRQADLNKKEVSKSDIKLILDSVPHFRKKLHHLVMLADTDHHTLSDLAFIVIWSLLAGVPYISFYDVTGKKNFSNFYTHRTKLLVPNYIYLPSSNIVL